MAKDEERSQDLELFTTRPNYQDFQIRHEHKAS